MSTTQIFDDLNKALNDAEELFRARLFRVRATITLTTGDELAFGKLDGRWAFEVGGQPLTGANLQQKVTMAKALPELWTALETMEDERYRDIVRTTEELVRWLDTLDATPRTEAP